MKLGNNFKEDGVETTSALPIYSSRSRFQADLKASHPEAYRDMDSC